MLLSGLKEVKTLIGYAGLITGLGILTLGILNMFGIAYEQFGVSAIKSGGIFISYGVAILAMTMLLSPIIFPQPRNNK